MFFPGLSYHHHGGAPEAATYDDRDHSLVVLLTFAIFFSFVFLYLIVGVVWASVVTACAVALSFCYLNARRRNVTRRAIAAGAGLRLARARSDGRLDGHLPPVVPTIPTFVYKRERGGGNAAGSGWAQCVICLGLVQVGEVVRRLPACKHLFHAGCIDMWLRSHSTCPICRAVVVELADGRSEPPPV